LGVVHERRQTVIEPPIRYTGEQAISLFNPLSNSQFRAAPTEKQGAPSSEEFISEMLAHFDPQHVHQIWVAALQRRADDPEGAITLARTLLETVCKHILDEADTPNAESACSVSRNSKATPTGAGPTVRTNFSAGFRLLPDNRRGNRCSAEPFE